MKKKTKEVQTTAKKHSTAEYIGASLVIIGIIILFSLMVYGIIWLVLHYLITGLIALAIFLVLIGALLVVK